MRNIINNEDQIIFTIGHSNHTLLHFIDLLKSYKISAIADVRSVPYSTLHQQFNIKDLSENLKKNGIAYVFLGEELGAKPNDLFYYKDGKVDLDLIAESEQFKRGIQRLIKGSKKYRIAIMCSEKEPIRCHRAILIAPKLKKFGFTIKHILYDGSILEHIEIERQLIKFLNLKSTLFSDQLDESKIIELAYIKQLKKIAFRIKNEEGENG